jgi:glycosyltransferase involved in cell wall biosynthesis
MDAARVVAVPSLKQEGAPIVAIEAALAGRPVVASDDPGLRELLQTNSFGRVVPRGDVGALADELAAALTDPDRCDLMGRQARDVALKTWTLEVGIPRTREIYRRAQEVFGADEDRRRS